MLNHLLHGALQSVGCALLVLLTGDIHLSHAKNGLFKHILCIEKLARAGGK